MTQLNVRKSGAGWIVEDAPAPARRVSRSAARRSSPKPLVSDNALIVGYLLALLIVGLAGALLANYAR